MYYAVLKYFEYPTMQTLSFKNIVEVNPPCLLLCPARQYDWHEAQRLGYFRKSDFLLGKVAGANQSLTWIGNNTAAANTRDGNL